MGSCCAKPVKKKNQHDYHQENEYKHDSHPNKFRNEDYDSEEEGRKNKQKTYQIKGKGVQIGGQQKDIESEQDRRNVIAEAAEKRLKDNLQKGMGTKGLVEMQLYEMKQKELQKYNTNETYNLRYKMN